ncbi:MAG: alpha-hydroxy-acid oxidizing protein [Sporomusaceae bacterium]|nr:alpha-hydroxy-acid oxidizing protein [Sporomusaceae bacterium]
MDWKELRATARQRFQGACRVCPVCNGLVCSGEVPGMGGLGTGAAFRNNVAALAALRLNMRTVHAVAAVDTGISLFGSTLALPVIGAAIGGIALNMNAAMPEADYARAVVDGCRLAGTVAMTGDGPAPLVFEAGLTAVEAAGGMAIPVIKPRETTRIVEMAKRAAAAGALAFGIDIDAAALVNMTNAGQPVGPKTARELAAIKRQTEIPFIVKGIMTVDEAVACRDAGVDAIVVSNHGGRALDHTPGTAEVLPVIAAAVGGGSLRVLADGGVRSGADILKMLALGADAVLLGRPLAQGVIGGGRDGAAAVLDKLHSELTAAMILTGTARAAAVSPAVIWRCPA